jgi:hypothetical protein
LQGGFVSSRPAEVTGSKGVGEGGVDMDGFHVKFTGISFRIRATPRTHPSGR